MNKKKAYIDLINEINNVEIKTMLTSLLNNNLIGLIYLAACLSCLSYHLNYTEENVKIFNKIKEILYRNGILPLSYIKGLKRIYNDSKYDDVNSEYFGFRNILFSINHFYSKKERRNIEVRNGMIHIPISTEIVEKT